MHAFDDDLKDFGGVVRLFPLTGVVLLPHVVLPLHIFEPRYRQMMRDALRSDRRIAMVQARPGPVSSAWHAPELEPVACLGTILDHERLPDGRYNLLLRGRRRARIVRELCADTLYRQAEVELLDDVEPDDAPALRSDLIAAFRAYARTPGGCDPDLDRLLRADAALGVLTDILAHALDLPPSLKQSLLAEPRVDSRAAILLSLLRDAPGRRPAYPPPFSAN